ncbi:methyl-accepting chemotaxis protein [Geotalea toluenoxydans]|uniref:methyl-accepting chemotaxis protein n=1 Tax=Geotalea toluenoxydans TaxID=421624 RepID=UPI0006CFCEEB|nr:methyl-accepting chemotaxis protein [Geotalea toluenoxydans]
MFFKKYLSSMKSTCIFMLCFGLFMGIIFPFYSWLFFGKRAFTPMYVIGCMLAGIAVGTFCYYIIKQVMKIHVENQWRTLSAIAGQEEMERIGKGGDELKLLLECHDLLLGKVLKMVENVAALSLDINSYHRGIGDQSKEIVQSGEKQVAKEKETLQAVRDMNGFFNDLLLEIEDISRRTDERASITAEMSATTDMIAGNIKDFTASVLETSASIEEMASSINETATNVEALALSTEQTSSSISEISAVNNNVRDNAQRTSECAEDMRKKATEGMQSMAATLKAMREIEKTNADSFAAINRLSVHSARVGEFLNVIKEVVDQTNLLSLNASIIAAQAGEQGKSFSVVAEEVRSLAKRTSLSAKEIQELVTSIQKETAEVQRTISQEKDRIRDGVKISAIANTALEKIAQGTAEASQMVQKIATSTVEQAAASKMITEEAEKNLDRVKQFTGAIHEQKRGIGLIVRALDKMRSFSALISNSTQEQSRGNRLYLKSVMEDNDRVKQLKETAVQQIMMGDVLLNYVTEAGLLNEANSMLAEDMMKKIKVIAALTDRMHTELAPFVAKRQ